VLGLAALAATTVFVKAADGVTVPTSTVPMIREEAREVEINIVLLHMGAKMVRKEAFAGVPKLALWT
jgi:hypothetical protein